MGNLPRYNFFNNDKTLVFFSLPDLFRIQKLLVIILTSMMIIVICLSSMRTCSPYNGTQMETLVMLPGLWLECHIPKCTQNQIWLDSIKEHIIRVRTSLPTKGWIENIAHQPTSETPNTMKVYKGMDHRRYPLPRFLPWISVLCCWEYHAPPCLGKVLTTGVCNRTSHQDG